MDPCTNSSRLEQFMKFLFLIERMLVDSGIVSLKYWFFC